MTAGASPEIVASAIGAVGTVIATVLASLVAWMLGRQVAQRDKLKAQLAEAHTDIAFLLAVEERHCAMHRSHHGQSHKLRVREHVRQSSGCTWSGRHTPGRVQ
jgi:fumarate reductase subunit D